MIDISVLLPLYNCEDYIDECVESILLQFKNSSPLKWEIIIVNDGSTDEGAAKAEIFKSKYDNIFIFNKKNEGVSKTRNYALNKARGRYVYFIDPDDKLNYPILSEIILLMDLKNVDILKFGFDLSKRFGECGSDELLNPRFIGRNELLEETDKPGQCMLWQFVFRREIIGNVKFNENINYMEDYVFLLNVINKSNKNLKIDNAPYFYRLNNNSICNSKSEEGELKRHVCFAEIIKEILTFKKDNQENLSEYFKRQLDIRVNQMVERYCFNSIFLKRNFREIKLDLKFFEENLCYPFFHDNIVGTKFYSKFLAKIINNKFGFRVLHDVYMLFK